MNYDEFDRLCRENGTTPTALSLKLGLSKGNASSWKRGGNPSADILLKISDELNCTVDSLLRPIDKIKRIPQNLKVMHEKANTPLLSEDKKELLNYYNMLNEHDKGKIIGEAKALAELEAVKTISEPKQFEAEQANDEEENFIYLDMYDMPVSAGRGAYIDYAKAETVQVPKTYETEQANYMVRISGDSMEPRFKDKDVVLVETTAELSENDIGIFVLNGEAYIKQLGDGCLISLNSKYPPIVINEYDTCLLKGRVISILDIKK